MNTETQKDGTLKPTHPQIEQYIFHQLKRHDEPTLLEMEALAKKESFPIVGRLVGAFLEVQALSCQAKRIFEFGSGFGYSAYWFSRAVGPEGKVICTENDSKNIEKAEKFLRSVQRWEQVEYHQGWAQEIFQKTEGPFDLIYNDANKKGYPEIWNLSKERLRKGGLYICDNTLWSGRVTQGPSADDKNPGMTEGIKKHNELIANDPEFDFFYNPLRDGVIVARKKS